MSAMTIAFRIADDAHYHIKRNRLHHSILDFFGAENVFDELTSLYVVQSAVPAATLAARFGKEAGLTTQDKLLVMDGPTGSPATYGGFANVAKLYRVMNPFRLGNILAQYYGDSGLK